MADIDTKRIRPGPATQQYVDSSLWHVERAQEAHGEAAAALAAAAEASRLLYRLGGSAERTRLALEAENAANRALAAVRAAELRAQDVATYMRQLSGDAESSREARAGQRGDGGTRAGEGSSSGKVKLNGTGAAAG
ncbi:MAG: hypothetical protein RRC07_09095 [Anaerolineae bacterium]|nr:hypothetical protein [Anaerolineae bacterium]